MRLAALVGFAGLSLVRAALPQVVENVENVEDVEPLVTGRTVDERGRPVAGVAMFAEDSRGGFDGEPVARTGADGAFEVRWRAPERPPYLLLRAAGRASRRVRVSAAPIGTVAMGPGRTISGVVRDAAGAPLAGVRVVASDMLATRPFLVLREDGTFEFRYVLGGRWEMELVCPLPPRTGRPLRVPIQQLHVRGDIDRFFKVAGPVTAQLRGRVELRGGEGPSSG